MNITAMGGRKFLLSRRKNSERKKRLKKKGALQVSIPRELVCLRSFRLSFPISVFAEGHVLSLESLSSRIATLSLPESWKIASLNPLTLCQLRIQHKSSQARADVSLSLSITIQLQYVFTIPDVKSFLSQRLCQDPLENFFGCQRQRGGGARQPKCSRIHEEHPSIEGD